MRDRCLGSHASVPNFHLKFDICRQFVELVVARNGLGFSTGFKSLSPHIEKT